MLPGHIPLEVFRARPNGRRLWIRPTTRWRDYISYLAWEGFMVSQEELENIAVEKDIWNTLFNLLTPHPTPDKRQKMDG